MRTFKNLTQTTNGKPWFPNAVVDWLQNVNEKSQGHKNDEANSLISSIASSVKPTCEESRSQPFATSFVPWPRGTRAVFRPNGLRAALRHHAAQVESKVSRAPEPGSQNCRRRTSSVFFGIFVYSTDVASEIPLTSWTSDCGSSLRDSTAQLLGNDRTAGAPLISNKQHMYCWWWIKIRYSLVEISEIIRSI